MPNLLRKWKTQDVVLSVLLILLVPVTFHCIESPLKPVAPSWTTQLTIPLIERTYYFKNLIAKDSARFVTVNNELVYRPSALDNEPTAITIPNLDPVEALFVRQLGIIPLTSFSVPGVDLSFRDMTGQDPPGFQWPFGEQNISRDTIIVSDTASLDYIIYEKGQMKITVSNSFNFDINFPDPIELVNANDTTQIIGKFAIGTVPKDGGEKSSAVSLNGKKMGFRLRMKFKFKTVDLSNKVVNNGRIAAVISVTRDGAGDPSLAEAKMKLLNEFYVPVTDIRDSVQQLDDSIFIKSAEFKGGAFDIVINNGIPFDVIVGFNLREFVDKATNQSFRLIDPQTKMPNDSITLSGGQIYIMPVLMKNYRFEARKANGSTDTLTRGIHFSLNIKTLIKSGTKLVIRKTDSILVQIRPHQVGGINQPYVLDYVRGKIPPTRVDISESVEAGIGSSTEKFSADSVKFDGAKITLKIFSQSLFPTDLKFTVTGVSNGVQGDSLSTPVGKGKNFSPDGVSYRIFPGDTAKIIFDKNNPDANGKTIDRFLSNFVRNRQFSFPERFDITGRATLEPKDAYEKDSVGFVKNNDSIYTSLEFSFPLKIGIMNGSYKDTASIAGNIEDTSQINSIVSGKIMFDVHSTFPIGIEVRTKLLKASALDPNQPDKNALPVLVLDTIRIAGDDTPDRSGTKSFTFISLTGDQAKDISKAAFTAIDLHLGTAKDKGSTPVVFQRQDSIKIRTSANVKFNVDFDRLTNK